MSNQSKIRAVQCPKCMGNRYLPIRSGSTSVRSCDRCGADGWVEDTADQEEPKLERRSEPMSGSLNPFAGPMPEGWPERQRAMGEAFSKAMEKMHSPFVTTPEPLSSNGLDQNEGGLGTTVQTPPHYQSSSGTTPWDLQRGMKSSGNAFVDGRRCDAIKYAFRVKQNMAEDLRKAAHCLMEAVAVLEAGGDKSAAVDRILDEVFNPAPLGIYNDWPFWKRESKDTPWVAELNGIMLFRRTKEELFASIEAENAKRKETT